MEKITATAYVFMHLTRTDFLAAFVGWGMRCMFDWFNARHKVNFRAGEAVFTNRRYVEENWDRIVVSFFFSLGFMIFIPEAVVVGGSMLLGRAVAWSSGFSGLLGLLGFEIINALMKGGRRRLTRLISGEDPLTLPASSVAGDPTADEAGSPDEGRDGEPRPPRGQVYTLLLLLALGGSLLSGCATGRQRALNKAQRHARGMAAVLVQYPDLADSLNTRRIDTLRVPGRRDSASWVRPQDTPAFLALLEDYARQQAAYKQAQAQVRQLSLGLPGPAAGEHGQHAADFGPSTAAAAALQSAQQQAARLQAVLVQLRGKLQQGAYVDTTYQYKDPYLAATITLYAGRLSFLYDMLPQRHAYEKQLTTLRPAAALPENCQPRRFWQDWLFWVLLGGLGAVYFGGRALLSKLGGFIS